MFYVGNFEPPHSTENDLLRTLRDNGANVEPIQESDEAGWDHLIKVIAQRSDHPGGIILWTRTKSLTEKIPVKKRWEMVATARLSHWRLFGVHLDRWWGLNRQDEVYSDPFFRVEKLWTPDADHAIAYGALGIDHHWMPPAIAPHNVKRGTPRDEFRCKIAFVGSWQPGYHAEWPHRYELIRFLERTYGPHFRKFPAKGQPAIRGDDLADLYASADVVVGDSCLVPTIAGQSMEYYCSDRVFETVGRGGLLIHPQVRKVLSIADHEPLLEHDKHAISWKLGDWDGLKVVIAQMLHYPEERRRIQAEGFAHVKANHTYLQRLEQVLDLPAEKWYQL